MNKKTAKMGKKQGYTGKMEQTASLQSIMNRMVGRLEQIVPDAVYADAGYDADWPLLQIYIRLDPLLADLFKQYQDAQKQLDKLEKARGPDDPLTDVTRDMTDSARAAVLTRYIELQEDEEFQGSATATAQKIKMMDMHALEQNDMVRRKQKDENIYSGLAFMIWAAMIMEQKRQVESLRESFARSLKLAQSAA